MARALGVSAAAVASSAALAKTAAAATKTVAAASAKVAAGAGTTPVLPWMAVGVLGLALAGAIVGARAWKTSPSPQPAPAVKASAPESAAESSPAVPAPSLADRAGSFRRGPAATGIGGRACRPPAALSLCRPRMCGSKPPLSMQPATPWRRVPPTRRWASAPLPGQVPRRRLSSRGSRAQDRGAGETGPERRGPRAGQPLRGGVRRRTAHGSRKTRCWCGVTLDRRRRLDSGYHRRRPTPTLAEVVKREVRVEDDRRELIGVAPKGEPGSDARKKLDPRTQVHGEDTGRAGGSKKVRDRRGGIGVRAAGRHAAEQRCRAGPHGHDRDP